MKIEKIPEGIKVTEISDLSLPETLDCGQCFRWIEREDSSFFGVVRDKTLLIKQQDDTLILYNTTKEDFDSF